MKMKKDETSGIVFVDDEMQRYLEQLSTNRWQLQDSRFEIVRDIEKKTQELHRVAAQVLGCEEQLKQLDAQIEVIDKELQDILKDSLVLEDGAPAEEMEEDSSPDSRSPTKKEKVAIIGAIADKIMNELLEKSDFNHEELLVAVLAKAKEQHKGVRFYTKHVSLSLRAKIGRRIYSGSLKRTLIDGVNRYSKPD